MPNNNNTLKWIYKNVKRYIPMILILTVIASIISFISVRFALASKNLIDVATKGFNENLIKSVLIFVVLIGLQLILQIIYSLILVRTLGNIKIYLKEKCFNSVLKKDYISISSYHSGELLNRINSDVDIISSSVISLIPDFFSLITQIILSLIVLFSLDKLLAVICIIVCPFALIFARIYSKYMKKMHKEYQATDSKARSFMQECLENILVIKAFRNEKPISKAETKFMRKNYDVSIKRNNMSIFASIIFYLFLTAGFYIALIYSAYKISIGIMTFGTLTAILQLVGNIQTPFRSLSGLIPEYAGMIASGERILEIINLKDDYSSDEKYDILSLYENLDEIILSNISFSYDEEKVLDNANLTINKGEFIAISGQSGIGKSTTFKLLLSLISPSSGEIGFKCGDRFIKADKKTRNVFSYVPQSNMILSGTIKENLLFYKENVSDEEIYNAAKVADIYDFIMSLPNGFETKLGEKGLGLSDGQVQRIAIARAILHNSPIILLDESTSSLDENTEKNVLANIKQLKTKTCIIISHRRAAFEVCDRRITITNGKFYE